MKTPRGTRKPRAPAGQGSGKKHAKKGSRAAAGTNGKGGRRGASPPPSPPPPPPAPAPLPPHHGAFLVLGAALATFRGRPSWEAALHDALLLEGLTARLQASLPTNPTELQGLQEQVRATFLQPTPAALPHV